MNYIKQLNAFNELQPINRLSTGQIALWYALMYVNNKCAWIEWFSVSNKTLELTTGLTRDGILKARNVLKQKGYINIKASGTKATYYTIFKLYQNTLESDTIVNNLQVGMQDSMQVGMQDSMQVSTTLNKQNRNKTKQDTILHGAEAPCESVIQIILNDKSYHPVTQDEVDRWHELYPAVDIMAQLRAMAGWCEANNTKRKTKTGINKFINSWLAKEQNKGGGINANSGTSKENPWAKLGTTV